MAKKRRRVPKDKATGLPKKYLSGAKNRSAKARELKRTAEAYNTNALSSSEELRRIAVASYSGGEIAVFEVIDALQTARDARLQNLELQHDARTALIALSALFPEISQ